MRIAYMTAGTVGAGHMVRGIAVGRALHRSGFAGEYRMFGPELRFPLAAAHAYESVAIRREELLDRDSALQSPLAAALLRFRPDVLVVDLFWAPLRYILPLPGCEAWLLLRCCPPQWFVGEAESLFDPSLFSRLIAIETLPTMPGGAELIDPVVVANPDECRPRTALRERFGVAGGERLVAVVHAGMPGEIDELRVDPGAAHVLRIDLANQSALFPAAEWLGGADLVVCGAGYNSFWEAHWLGYARRTRFSPFPRLIDDQAFRLRRFAGDAPARNGADTLARWLTGAG